MTAPRLAEQLAEVLLALDAALRARFDESPRPPSLRRRQQPTPRRRLLGVAALTRRWLRRSSAARAAK